MNEASTITVAADVLPYICGKHQIELTHVLRGGAGHCASCAMFVQSSNHVEPERPTPRPSVKELAKAKAKVKAKAKTAAANLTKPNIRSRARARQIKQRIIAA